MKAHLVHLSTYPADDIRVFQKACRAEAAEGYKVTQVVCDTAPRIVDGVEICSVQGSKGRLSRVLGLSWRMYLKAKRQKADLYQIHHPDLILAGLLLKLAGKKVIYEPREFFPDKILSMTWIPPFLRKTVNLLFSAYERLCSRVWDHVIVADRYTATAFAGRPVTVIPNYPLLTKIDAPVKRKGFRRKLIYVGGLTEERGLFVMLRIAQLLEHHNVDLELMGHFAVPEHELRVNQLANVHYLGNQDLGAVYRHLVAADLGLLLLQPVPAYKYAGENTLKLFEYMWCGLPVISSNFPNLAKIIEAAQCGICMDPCDADSAAEQILSLLEDQELRRIMSMNGKEAVIQAYNWPAASGLMFDAYYNVLNGVRSAGPSLPLWCKASSDNAQPAV